MMNGKGIAWVSVLLFVVPLAATARVRLALAEHGSAEPESTPVGIFEGHQDIGTVLHPGSA